MTARYNVVYSRLWASSGFRSWSEDGRTAALYLLTCPARNTEGFFRLPMPLAAHELQWSIERVQAAFAELEAAEFIAVDPDADLVWLVNAVAWNMPKGPKRIKGAVNALSELPSSALRSSYLVKCRSTCPELAEAITAHLGWTDTPSIPLRRGSGTPPITHSQSLTQTQAQPQPQGEPSTPIDPTCTTPAEEGDDLPSKLLDLCGLAEGTKPTKGERATVANLLRKGYTREHLEARAARASLADMNPRALLMTLLTEDLNQPPPTPEIASTSAALGGPIPMRREPTADVVARTYRPYQPAPEPDPFALTRELEQRFAAIAGEESGR